MSTRTSTPAADAWDPRTDPVIELRGVHVIHRSRTGGLLRPEARGKGTLRLGCELLA